MRIRCRGKPLTEQLPSDSPVFVDVFTCRYQAKAVVPLFASRSLPSNRSIRHNIVGSFVRLFTDSVSHSYCCMSVE
jgi:hypothetical protein